MPYHPPYPSVDASLSAYEQQRLVTIWTNQCCLADKFGGSVENICRVPSRVPRRSNAASAAACDAEYFPREVRERPKRNRQQPHRLDPSHCVVKREKKTNPDERKPDERISAMGRFATLVVAPSADASGDRLLRLVFGTIVASCGHHGAARLGRTCHGMARVVRRVIRMPPPLFKWQTAAAHQLALSPECTAAMGRFSPLSTRAFSYIVRGRKETSLADALERTCKGMARVVREVRPVGRIIFNASASRNLSNDLARFRFEDLPLMPSFLSATYAWKDVKLQHGPHKHEGSNIQIKSSRMTTEADYPWDENRPKEFHLGMWPCFRMGAWAWEIAIRCREYRYGDKLRKLVFRILVAHNKTSTERTEEDDDVLKQLEAIARRRRPLAHCHSPGCKACAATTPYLDAGVTRLPECALLTYRTAVYHGNPLKNGVMVCPCGHCDTGELADIFALAKASASSDA